METIAKVSALISTFFGIWLLLQSYDELNWIRFCVGTMFIIIGVLTYIVNL